MGGLADDPETEHMIEGEGSFAVAGLLDGWELGLQSKDPGSKRLRKPEIPMEGGGNDDELSCSLLSEPSAGSGNSGRLTFRAKRTGGGVRRTGLAV